MSSKAQNNTLLALYALLVVGLPVAGLTNALLYSVGLAGPRLAGPQLSGTTVPGVSEPGLTLVHWQRLTTETGLIGSLAYSFYIAVAAVGLAVLGALALVLGGQKTVGRWPFPGLLYVPLLFPSVVVGFYLFQLLSQSGWLSRVSFGLGLTSDIEAFPELVQDGAGIGIMLAHVFMAFPFFALLFRSLYADARLADYHSVALTLGATRGQFLRRIAVPILLRRAAPTLILSGVAVVGAYDIPLLLGQTYPQMVSVFITERLQRFDLADLPVGYGAGVVVAVLLMSLIWAATRNREQYAL